MAGWMGEAGEGFPHGDAESADACLVKKPLAILRSSTRSMLLTLDKAQEVNLEVLEVNLGGTGRGEDGVCSCQYFDSSIDSTLIHSSTSFPRAE